MTIPQQQIGTHIRRAGTSAILVLGLVLLGIVAINYRTANISGSADRTAQLQSMSDYGRSSDELLPKCMIHVCEQRLPALNVDGNRDASIPDCMVHICVSRSAAPSDDRNVDGMLPECMIHVCVQPLAASSADRNMDARSRD